MSFALCAQKENYCGYLGTEFGILKLIIKW